MKSVLASKKFWFNLLTVALTVATFAGFTPNQQLAEQTTGILIALNPLVNLFLVMFFSKRGIEPVL